MTHHEIDGIDIFWCFKNTQKFPSSSCIAAIKFNSSLFSRLLKQNFNDDVTAAMIKFYSTNTFPFQHRHLFIECLHRQLQVCRQSIFLSPYCLKFQVEFFGWQKKILKCNDTLLQLIYFNWTAMTFLYKVCWQIEPLFQPSSHTTCVLSKSPLH